MNYKVILTVKEQYRLGGYIGESVIVSGKDKALSIATDYKAKGLHDVKVIRV